MDHIEIEKQLKMTYKDLVLYLQNKYGLAVCPYFCNEKCRSVSSRVRRTSEGLFCHHVKEDEGACLCEPLVARDQPFSWQQPENLVYCNILEHLILHLKIAQEKDRASAGIIATCGQLNDFFGGYKSEKEYLNKIYSLIENNYKDYIKIIKLFLQCNCAKEMDVGRLACGIKTLYSEKVAEDLNLKFSDILKTQGMGLVKAKKIILKKNNLNKIEYKLKKCKINSICELYIF